MEAPASRPYEGPSGIGRESNWLTNEDLVEGRDFNVEIEAILLYPQVKFEGGRIRQNVLGLKFKKANRVLLLNATNRKTLNKAFGNITKAWIGQKVTLFVSETQMAGETVKCVRIRSQRSRAATATEEFLSGEDEPRAPVAEVGQHEETEAAAAVDPRLKVTEACQALGVSIKEQGELIKKHEGDYDAMLRELTERAEKSSAA